MTDTGPVLRGDEPILAHLQSVDRLQRRIDDLAAEGIAPAGFADLEAELDATITAMADCDLGSDNALAAVAVVLSRYWSRHRDFPGAAETLFLALCLRLIDRATA